MSLVHFHFLFLIWSYIDLCLVIFQSYRLGIILTYDTTSILVKYLTTSGWLFVHFRRRWFLQGLDLYTALNSGKMSFVLFTRLWTSTYQSVMQVAECLSAPTKASLQMLSWLVASLTFLSIISAVQTSSALAWFFTGISWKLWGSKQRFSGLDVCDTPAVSPN